MLGYLKTKHAFFATSTAEVESAGTSVKRQKKIL